MSTMPYLSLQFQDPLWKVHGVATLLQWAGVQVYPWSASNEWILEILPAIFHALHLGGVDFSLSRPLGAALEFVRLFSSRRPLQPA